MADPVLEIRDLRGFYGQSPVLHGLDLQIGTDPVAIIGRNGMGKTTLCRAIMGLLDRASGSIRLYGQELIGEAPHSIASAGIGYVPQGRSLFPSLTVDEHLRLVAGFSRRRGQWDPDRIYSLFPQLARRRSLGGTQLSGGEQQMLAVGRALVSNPRLLLMDEPSEGLAPKIIAELVDAIGELVQSGVGLVVVEQNLAVATALADRIVVMATGQIVMETTGAAFRIDEEAQRRYLGVGTALAATSEP